MGHDGRLSVTTSDDILRDHSTAVQETAAALRALLHDTAPDLREKAYPGWHGIGFRHPKAGYVCGVFPQDATVRLLFEHGHQLADPDGVFTGGGTQTRYIEIATPDEIPADAIRRLVLEAIAL